MHQKSVLFFLITWFGIWGFAFIFWSNDQIFLFFNTLFSPIPTFWNWITFGGEGWFLGILTLFVMYFKGWRMGVWLGLCPSLAGLLGQFFKRVVFPNSDRPKLYFEKIHQSIQVPDGIEIHLHHSFPSGHTIGAFAFFYFSIFIFHKKSSSIFFIIFAALVGLSRIFLAQHFPIDVIFGSFIGIIFAEIWWRMIPSKWVVNNA